MTCVLPRLFAANHLLAMVLFLCVVIHANAANAPLPAEPGRLRLIIETDAGGDPDDEQSLVRFLPYAADFDIEGLIANRPAARDGENRNPVRDGLGIVRAMVDAYGQCHANLTQHDRRYPTAKYLLERTVPGYDNTDEEVKLIQRICRTISVPEWTPCTELFGCPHIA